MSQPQPDQNAVPDGYRPAAAPPYQDQSYQGQQSQGQPHQNQQPGNQTAPQYQAVPQQYAAPQQPYPGQAPQHQPYPQQFAAPQQQYPGQSPQHGHYQPQPQMPNYGYAQPKSKVTAGLLGIFLGGLGIHRFYLGFTKIAVIQLILTLVLGVFTFGLVGLWGVVEGVMIIAGSARFRVDAQGIPLRD